MLFRSNTKKSDIDIYIDFCSKKDKKLIEEISEEISVVFGKFNSKNNLFNEIMKDHVVLNNLEGFLNLIK